MDTLSMTKEQKFTCRLFDYSLTIAMGLIIGTFFSSLMAGIIVVVVITLLIELLIWADANPPESR